MIKNDFDDLYVGITKDLETRIKTHNNSRGALYTKKKSKFNLVFQEQYNSPQEARTREIQIKKWSRKKKELLILRFKEGLPTKMK